MTNEELKNRIKWGYKRDHKDERDYLMTVSRREIETLPPSAILNDKTPVEDQGNLGSCTGNAGDNAFKIRDLLVTGDFFNGSRLALYYWAREIDGDVSEDNGSELRTMAQVLAKKGVPPETDWPYITSKFAIKPPANVDADAAKSVATKYYRVDGNTPTETLNNIKAAISTNYPVMFGFDVYNNFFDIDSSGNMPMGAGGLAGGHAVCVVGYDDTHANIDGSKGALFIKNSWGSGWGANGYFWMPYNYVIIANDNVGDAWEIIDESDFVPVPPIPNPVPTCCFLTSSAANPGLGKSVTLTATLYDATAWKGIPKKTLLIYHYLKNIRYDDGTVTTSWTGSATFKQQFTTAGTRPYYVSFKGDATYKASTSGMGLFVK